MIVALLRDSVAEQDGKAAGSTAALVELLRANELDTHFVAKRWLLDRNKVFEEAGMQHHSPRSYSRSPRHVLACGLKGESRPSRWG